MNAHADPRDAMRTCVTTVRTLVAMFIIQLQSSGAFAVVLAEQLVASVVVQTSYMLAQQNVTSVPTVRSSGH